MSGTISSLTENCPSQGVCPQEKYTENRSCLVDVKQMLIVGLKKFLSICCYILSVALIAVSVLVLIPIYFLVGLFFIIIKGGKVGAKPAKKILDMYICLLSKSSTLFLPNEEIS